MNNLKEVNEQIEANKEILNTFPRNNAKNIKACLTQIQEYKQTFTDAQSKLLEEMKKRIEKLEEIKKSEEVIKLEEQVAEKERTLHVINKYKTSYEKMDLDRILFNLNVFYRKNLDVVNEAIQKAIEKFKEVGIPLMPKDFTYSKYANEHMVVFFQEMEKDNVNSERIKTEFEKIYWKCPDIIIHIRLNILYIYTENEKNIDKYYENQKQNVLNKLNADTAKVYEKYKATKIKLYDIIETDKFTIINHFLDGQLVEKDYEEDKIKQEYNKVLAKGITQSTSKKAIKEISENVIKFINSLEEYKNFLKYQFIYDDIKSKYKQREDHKNNYATTKKEITSKEKQLKSLNKKINSKGIFSKKEKQEKQIAQYNETINQIQELYKKLDEEEIYQKIIANLNDDSTIFDALYFASKFTNYLTECIINNNKTITQPEIDELIDGLREFLSNPYIIIIKNITILEDKNIPMIISDRYKLLNFKIEKEDITDSNIDTLISGLQKIKNYYNFQKAGIDLEKMKFICEAQKVLA